MSGKVENTAENSVADGTTNNKLSEEDKFGVYESSTTDSGFISGGITISREIHPDQEESPPDDADTADADDDKPKETYMRLDSGVDLSESFSGLCLKNPSSFNDLSCSKKKLAPETPVAIESKPDILANCFHQDSEDGNTYLHIMIYQGFIEVVLAIIRRAPRPVFLDTPNDDAETPIHLAVATGQWRIVRWLIVAGAKPSPRNIHGDSPLHIAARNGDLMCCKAITDPVQEQERQGLALGYAQQPYQPASLDQWNYEGQTCVHLAAMHGHIDILRHLVWYGADINAREGRQGYSALHYAVERGDERMVLFLLTECKKLDTDVETYGGNSALQLGFPVPTTISEVLRSRGVPSPYSSDDDDDEEFSDSDNELLYENAMFVQNLVNASA